MEQQELADWVETHVDGAAERVTVQGILGQRIANRLQQCERHKCFA